MRATTGNNGKGGAINGQGFLFALEESPDGALAPQPSRTPSRSKARPNGLPEQRRRTSPSTDASALMQNVLTEIDGRLCQIEAAIESLRQQVSVQSIIKEFYTTAELAQILGRRPYTVREWCRLGRVNAEKAHSGRGLDDEWRVSHEELVRIQNEGLLAIQKFSRVAAPGRLAK